MKELNKIYMNLNYNNKQKKIKEIKEYFLNTWNQFEKIFDLLKNDDVFYQKSEITRHPMIFYYGHTATFFINKLITANVISKRINPSFESIFAIGVDEMSWDDVNSLNYAWPSVNEVKEYRNKVKDLVLKLINTIDFSLPISWDSDMWIILMGIEHEKIHIETSLVLHRQMPIELINQDANFEICTEFFDCVENEMINIPSTKINLGKAKDNDLYGWDNEYGTYSEDVMEFKASKYLVSNEEFMPFVQNGGYEEKSYWCEEGKEFLKNLKKKYPSFWIKQNKTFKYRALNKIIDMPLSWPVDVNSLEAKAFLKYKSKKDNITYALPSEAQYKAIYNYSNISKTYDANENLNLYSSCPVNKHEFNGIFDVVGNVWQWSCTKMFAYEGFEIHDAYDDFTVPTFDNKHAIINGTSWASTGNLIDSYSRYAFREHFYQNAGFRYIINKQNKIKEENVNDNIYETNQLVSQYCEFQYGKEYFGVEIFSIACANIAKKYINNSNKVLDIGCATGRLSFELAKYFNKVEGLDFSARFIQVGVALQNENELNYRAYDEGELYNDEKISLKQLGYDDIKHKVSFHQGDACNLKANFKEYDMIIGTNLIDRLYDPKLFLNDIAHRLNKDGILILTSPYTWLEQYTKKEKWLGGYIDENNKEVKTIDTLQAILKDNFILLHKQDVSFVIKETKRKYQHTVSQLSVWKKR